MRTLEDLKQLKSSFYAKNGEFSELKTQISRALSLEEKRVLGRQLNRLKEEAESLFRELAAKVHNEFLLLQASKKWYDVGLPINKSGGLHPITVIKNRFRT